MHSPTIPRPRTSDPLLPSAGPGVDRERFEALYARHRDELARYCRSILRHDQDVEDALQSTMTKAFAALRTETREIALRPWLFRIAHNEAISIVRRRVDVAELDDRDGGNPDVVPDAVETRERLRLLREDLGDLPQRQRSALVLRELSGLGHREIADVLGSSPSAVKQAIYEARCALGDCAAGRSLTCDRVRRALSDGDGRTAARRRLRAHLRSCRACRTFDAALRQRPQDLGALFPAGPAVAAGGAVAGLSGLVAGAGGGAVGAGSATVGVGVTTVGVGSATVGLGTAGSGGLLGGALAGAGAAKLAGIAAVAVVAGGGAVAVERGTFASSAPESGAASAVVREAPSTTGPALRFAAATGGSSAAPVVTPLPGGRRTSSESAKPESRSRKRGAAGTAPAASRRGRSDRSAADSGASATGPAKRARSATNGRSPAGAPSNRGTNGRPADAGRRGAAAAQSARTKSARAAIKRSPAKAPQGAPSSTGQGAGSAPAASGSTGTAHGATPGKGNGSDGAPTTTAAPPNAASPATGSSGKVAASPAPSSAGPPSD
jgi:RNA polymerase sigma factor (sigma-70 family)